MKITFLGAAKTVTGSNFLVEACGKKFLVDCGMYQGKATEEKENESDFLFDVSKIDFMLLTHAHIDHSGRIPKLYNDGYRNKIYATKATCDLCTIMLPDSGHIQEMEIEWKNRKRKREGKKELPPLYTAEEATKSLELFERVKYDEIIEIDENIKVRFNDAGHMLGSSIIEVWVDENGKTEKAVFTGDLGNNDIPLLASPTMIESADYLIMESTYGSRLHMRNDDKAELYKTLMSVPVFVDSPLAISATEIFRENTDLFDDEVKEEMEKGDNPLEFPGLQFTKTADESKALNESSQSSIIISASGMCEVGRIKHHLKHNLWNPNSTILFVGYQAPGTLGSKLVNGEKKVKIFGEEININARIEYIEGYSGHADQEWLLNFVYSFIKKPKHIFLVHGEEEAQEVLKEKILETTGIPVTIPDYGETYELADEITMTNKIELTTRYKPLRLEVLERMQKLKDEVSDMTNIIKEEIISENAKDTEVAIINERIKELESQIIRILEG